MITYALNRLVCPIDCPWLDRAFGPETIFYDAPDAVGAIASRGRPVCLTRGTNAYYQIPDAYLEIVAPNVEDSV